MSATIHSAKSRDEFDILLLGSLGIPLTLAGVFNGEITPFNHLSLVGISLLVYGYTRKFWAAALLWIIHPIAAIMLRISFELGVVG